MEEILGGPQLSSTSAWRPLAGEMRMKTDFLLLLKAVLLSLRVGDLAILYGFRAATVSDIDMKIREIEIPVKRCR